MKPPRAPSAIPGTEVAHEGRPAGLRLPAPREDAPRWEPGDGREARERFERAFADAPIGMALVGLNGRFLRVNGSLCKMLGLDEEALLASSFQDITHPADLDVDLAQVRRLVDGEIPGYSLEKRYRGAAGEWIWALLSVSLVRDEHGRPAYFISQIVDISERKRAEERLTELADHDALTGLLNRRRFGIDLSRRVAAARRGGAPALLILCDVDDFKYVNDTFGHHAGDRLIAHVARTLSAELQGQVVARLGGDEFAVLVHDVAAEQAPALVQGLCDLVARSPLLMGGEAVHLTLSAGAVMIDRQTGSDEDAMVDADVAMYDAKRHGRNRAVVWGQPGTGRERVAAALTWSRRLRRAVEGDGFLLYAQPIVDLESEEPAFFELLVRMWDDDGGVITPSVFMEAAERFRYVRQLDRWVVAEATRLATRHPGRSLSVNLSGSSLMAPGMASWIEDSIGAAGCRPDQLVFELTETEAITGVEQARTFVHHVRELGCRFALDDFGAGFAGFSHLKRLPIDIVKIDGQFVRDLASEDLSASIIRSIVSLAEEIGTIVVAEHVEDAAIAERVRALGVTLAQGYHYARPGPADEVL
jgi:diguanylate cyclase (GGDEF)-like protein/PAS domain S-box-containing protein